MTMYYYLKLNLQQKVLLFFFFLITLFFFILLYIVKSVSLTNDGTFKWKALLHDTVHTQYDKLRE